MDEFSTVEESVESTTTDHVEEVAESTTAEVEDVVESTTTDGLDFSENDILDDETEESELLTEEVEEEPSNVQKRINQLTRDKKLSEAKLAQSESMNKYLLSQSEKLKAPVQVPVEQKKPPVYNDFLEKHNHDSEAANEEYITAKIDYEVNGRLQAIESEKSQKDYLAKTMQAQADFETKSYTPEIMDKFPDFHGTVFNPLVQFTGQVRNLIQSSPQGHAIAYKLAKDQDLRDTINSVSPSVAGKHIGILEQQFSTPINKKLKSKSLKPIASIGNKARARKVKEEDLPIDEFLKNEHEKIRADGRF